MASTGPVVVNTAGAQPVVDYLTKDYAGFRQGMLNQIPLLLPQWTDRSEADFGVVLIELMAYVADILSYYQDRVANEAFLATATQRRSVADLLRLIDYQIDPGLAASALVHVDVSADVVVAGTALPYRLKTAGVAGEPDVTFEVTEEFALQALNNAIDLSAAAAIPAGSTALVLARPSHALAEGQAVYFEEETSNPDGTTRVRRSPRLTIAAVRDAGLGNDEIRWLPPLPEPFAPASTVLKGNNIVATHGTTVADEPIYVGDGTPGQAFTLSRIPATHRLRPQPSQRRRSQPDLDVRVDGVRWERVDSLIASQPADTHYTTSIDENDYLTIRFGTGARGSVPPAGSQVTATYRIGLGSRGNVGADTLTVFVSAVPEVTAISNPFPAAGGADRESTEEAKISVFDRGFLYGDSVYETIGTAYGRLFAAREHLDRLERSAQRIALRVPPRAEIERAIAETMAAAGNDESRVRVILTRGVGKLDLDPATASDTRLIVIVFPLGHPTREMYEGGVAVDMSREASLEMLDASLQQDGTAGTGASLVSLWQSNLVGLRAERELNWMRRSASAVAYLTGVAWGGAVNAS